MKPPVGYELVAAILVTADAFLRESQRLFRPYGLSGAQYNLLNVVAEADAGLSQRALSDRLVVDRSNITGLIDRMEAAGWVERRDDPGDRRAYRVQLTPAGRALWREVTPIYLAVVAQVTRGLPARRQTETVAVLRQLEQAASAWKLPERASTR